MTVHRDDSLVQAKLVSGLAEAPLWSPAGASLAWLTDPASGAADAVFVWSLGAHPAKLTASSVDRLAGWLDGNRLAGFVAGSAPKWRVIPIDRSRGTAGSLQRAPGRVVSPPNPRTGVIAYVPSPPEAWSIPARGIRLLDVSSGDDRLVVPEAEPYWTLCWTADGAALVFFDRSGRLFRAEPDLPLGAPLLETSHRVRRPRFSHGGGKVAWVDPGGSVRLADVDTRTRRQVNLPETPIAFAWEGERALLCLTASTETPLPMLYHATYALYRVPVDTLEPVRLPINPSRAN